MTISDDMHHKLSTVTEQLGMERSRHDRLKLDYDNLRDDYRAAVQRIRDMERDMAQIKEGV